MTHLKHIKNVLKQMTAVDNIHFKQQLHSLHSGTDEGI